MTPRPSPSRASCDHGMRLRHPHSRWPSPTRRLAFVAEGPRHLRRGEPAAARVISRSMSVVQQRRSRRARRRVRRRGHGERGQSEWALDQGNRPKMILLTGREAAVESCGDVVILSLVTPSARYRHRAKPQKRPRPTSEPLRTAPPASSNLFAQRAIAAIALFRLGVVRISRSPEE